MFIETIDVFIESDMFIEAIEKFYVFLMFVSFPRFLHFGFGGDKSGGGSGGGSGNFLFDIIRVSILFKKQYPDPTNQWNN